MTASSTSTRHDAPLDWREHQPLIDALADRIARENDEAKVAADEQWIRHAIAVELTSLKWVTDRFAQDFYAQYLSTGDADWKTAWFAARDHSEFLQTRADGIGSGRIDIPEKP